MTKVITPTQSFTNNTAKLSLKREFNRNNLVVMCPIEYITNTMQIKIAKFEVKNKIRSLMLLIEALL